MQQFSIRLADCRDIRPRMSAKKYKKRSIGCPSIFRTYEGVCPYKEKYKDLEGTIYKRRNVPRETKDIEDAANRVNLKM